MAGAGSHIAVARRRWAFGLNIEGARGDILQDRLGSDGRIGHAHAINARAFRGSVEHRLGIVRPSADATGSCAVPPIGRTENRGLTPNLSTHLIGYGSGFQVPGSRIGFTVRTLVPVWRWCRRIRADFGIPAWNPELIRHRNPNWNLVHGTRNRTQHKRVPV